MKIFRHDVEDRLPAGGGGAAGLFSEFLRDCRELQSTYDETSTGPWRMEPKNLEINMNG